MLILNKLSSFCSATLQADKWICHWRNHITGEKWIIKPLFFSAQFLCRDDMYPDIFLKCSLKLVVVVNEHRLRMRHCQELNSQSLWWPRVHKRWADTMRPHWRIINLWWSEFRWEIDSYSSPVMAVCYRDNLLILECRLVARDFLRWKFAFYTGLTCWRASFFAMVQLWPIIIIIIHLFLKCPFLPRSD